MTEVDEIVGTVIVIERLLDIVEDEMITVDEIFPEGIEEGTIVVDEAMVEDEDVIVVFPECTGACLQTDSCTHHLLHSTPGNYLYKDTDNTYQPPSQVAP